MKKIVIKTLLFLSISYCLFGFNGCSNCVPPDGLVEECESADRTWDDEACECVE